MRRDRAGNPMNWPAALSLKTTTCSRGLMTLMRGFGYEILRPLGSFSCRNAPVHLKATQPHRTTRPRSRTAVQAARSRACQSSTIFGCAARHSSLKLLDLFVGELLRLEFPPGTERAHISEGEIAGFPDAALGRFLQ